MIDPDSPPPADLIVACVVNDDAVFERHLAPCLRDTGIASVVVQGDADSCLASLYNEILDSTSQLLSEKSVNFRKQQSPAPIHRTQHL